jgi:hypothetical protein
MKSQHRGPFSACVILALACGLLLGNALRTQGVLDVITGTERYVARASVAIPIRLDLDLSRQIGAAGHAVTPIPRAVELALAPARPAVERRAEPDRRATAAPVTRAGRRHGGDAQADKRRTVSVEPAGRAITTRRADRSADAARQAPRQVTATPQRTAPARRATVPATSRTPGKATSHGPKAHGPKAKAPGRAKPHGKSRAHGQKATGHGKAKHSGAKPKGHGKLTHHGKHHGRSRGQGKRH